MLGLWLVFAPSALAASASAEDSRLAQLLPGTWRGTYVCGQGITGMRLTLRGASGGRLTGTWAFYAAPSNPGVPSGSVHLEGGVEDGKLRLEPKRWIDRPEGYVLVDALRAAVPVPAAKIDRGPEGRSDVRSAAFKFHAVAGQARIAGDVVEPGCSTFEVNLVPGSGAWHTPGFQCRLSGRSVPARLSRWRRCRRSKGYRGLQPGRKVFAVRVAGGGRIARRAWIVAGNAAPGPLAIPATARWAFFRVVCRSSTRCNARVTIAADNTSIARGSYSVSAHSSRRVRVRLTQAGRRALSSQARVRAKLTIVDPRTHKRETLPVVLKRRR